MREQFTKIILRAFQWFDHVQQYLVLIVRLSVIIHRLYVLNHRITREEDFYFFNEIHRNCVTRFIAVASLFVDDKTVFSFESFFTANGIDVAIPLMRLLFELPVVVVVDDDDWGRDVAVVKDFLAKSWLWERLFLDADDEDGGEVGARVDSLFVDVGLCSNREMRPREPNNALLFDVDCCAALSCNFWSSDRWDSSIDVDWYDVLGTKSFESSRISTSLVS